jgi:murein DD-endopeptidase MepM/ murein hydrolase activator NlpD
MKHFPKSIGQYLMTVLITSTILEVYTLPLLGTSIGVSSSQAAEPKSPSTQVELSTDASSGLSALPQAQEDSSPLVVETVPAPEPASEPAIAPVELSVPESSQPAIPIPVPAAESPTGAEPSAAEPPQPAASTSNTPSTPATPATAEMPTPASSPTSPAATSPAATDTSPASDRPSLGPTKNTKATPARPAPAANTSSTDRLTAARQSVSARLAALVNRDRLTRESQLQQNLIALALYYAQIGEFADARQVAQHPALPPEVQAATLAEIEQIVAQMTGQPAGQSVAEQSPVGPGVQIVTANPGQPNAATASPQNETITTIPIATVAPAGGYATVPVAPDLLQPYLSDRCLNPVASEAKTTPTPPSNSPAVTAARPTRTSPFLPIGRQVAARLAQPNLLAQKPTLSSNPSQAVRSIPITQTVVVKQTVALPVSTPAPNSGANQDALVSAAPAPLVSPDLVTGINTAELPQDHPQQAADLTASMTAANAQALLQNPDQNSPAASAVPMQETSRAKSLMASLQPLGIELPSSVSTALQPVLDSWFYATPSNFPMETTRKPSALTPTAASGTESQLLILPENSYGAQTQLIQYKQSLPKLIKLSRGGLKLSQPATQRAHSPVLVKQTVASPTSDYWRTIAVNCGGLETATSEGYTLDSSWGRRMTGTGMIFPLPIPVQLTSAFGWRIHPIRGDRRFHSGIDLGAPYGTPVLSALSGRVVEAGDMGGYGLAVIVEANSSQQQNLYAHLSAIAVKPGDRVEQGSVLGLVGSTGSSTGPHLHFETLLPSSEGWTAVDPLAAATAASIAQAQ